MSNDNTTARSQIIVEFECNLTFKKHDYFDDKEIARGDDLKLTDALLTALGIDTENPIELEITATVIEEPNRDRDIQIDSISFIHDPQISFPKSFYKYCKDRFWDEIVKAAQW